MQSKPSCIPGKQDLMLSQQWMPALGGGLAACLLY